MIADLKPYTEYRQAGLPWVDSVPKHWDMIPNRALMQERRGVVGDDAKDHILLSLTLRGVIARDMVNPKGKFPAEFHTYKVVQPGDFVFCLFDIDETPRGVGLSPLKGMITGAYDVFRPRSIGNPRFLYYYYLFVDDGKLMKPFYTGLRKTIQRGVFASLKVPCPPPDEQAAIVRFLGWATGRLERAIRAKRKAIALLNEQKQAIIHRAVTRGLDPSVPLKPSGIPWLGDIPKHWQVVPLKYLCRRIQNGATPPTSEQRYYTHGTMPWFGPSSIGTSSQLGAPVRHLTKAAFEDGKARLISGPAVLVVVIGTAGKMGLLLGEGATNQQITAFELRDIIAPEFGIHQLRTSEPWLRSTASTSTIPILDSGIVNRLPLALPSMGEQERILTNVSSETLPLTTAISRLEREIELFREYRTRLVADVVTGKLDVREAAARLPEEAPPCLIEDDADLGDETEAADEEAAE